MTAEPLNSPVEPENGCIASCDQPVAESDSDGQRQCHHHHSVTSPVKDDVDPWLLPQFDNDDSPRWNGMSLLMRYSITRLRSGTRSSATAEKQRVSSAFRCSRFQ